MATVRRAALAARYFKNVNTTRSIKHYLRSGVWSKYFHTSALVQDAINLRMPALSPTMQEGTIVKWHKKEGEPVSPGDVLCDIQTDKAVVSFEIEEEGVLAKILKPDNTKDVKIGTVIGVMVDEGDDWKNVEIPDTSSVEETPVVESQTPAPVSASPTVPVGGSKHHGYGPAVRSLLELYQLSINDIPATGPHNRVLKGDVLKYINKKGIKPAHETQPAPPPSTSSPVESPPSVPKVRPAVQDDSFSDLDLTSMRKTIAKRLTESKVTIPHAYSAIECNMKKVLEMRKELLANGTKVSVNDFIIKAVGIALQHVPEVNAGWNGESSQLFPTVDISVAVATENGLITPIVKDVPGLRIQEISQVVGELAGRARKGKLKLNEFQGGSFTISNLGMYGISEFTAVINPPQACILAVGTSRVVPDGSGVPQTIMTVTLSSDARVVDDALAAHFLQVFKDTMENPMLMLSQPTSSRFGDADLDEKLQQLFAK